MPCRIVINCRTVLSLVLIVTVFSIGPVWPLETSPSSGKRSLFELLNPDGLWRSYRLGTAVASPLTDPDDVYWDDQFQPSYANGEIAAWALDEAGTLYVGGQFTEIGAVSAHGIAKWDGRAWSPVGDGLGSFARVYAIATDGTDMYVGGMDLETAGWPWTGVAKWDGSSWSAVGEGLDSVVFALAVSGDTVYAGGSFEWSGDTSINRIAKWDGISWSPLGIGVTDWVRGIAVSGEDVYVSGDFWSAGGVPVDGLAKWNGSSWSAVGEGIGGPAIEVLDGNLYVAHSDGVVRWDGFGWSSLGTGTDDEVRCLTAGDGVLYAGGRFTQADGVAANHIARWNGSSWESLGSGTSANTVNAIAVNGTDVYAGGDFGTAGEVFSGGIAKWNGSSWSALGSGFTSDVGYPGQVTAIAADGNDVYIGGMFGTAGGIAANNLVRWDGLSWSPLGPGVTPPVYEILPYDGEVLVSGDIFPASGSDIRFLARWDGADWQPVGGGVDGAVYTMAADGTDLYVGGAFATAGGSAANGVAKWDGLSWSPLGGGIEGYVYDLVFSQGNLYAAGDFIKVGTEYTDLNVARWDGEYWHPVNPGIESTVNALAADETGNIYAGGNFFSVGGTPMPHIARWDGSEWSPLGSGLDGSVEWIEARDGIVYAAGGFNMSGTVPLYGLGAWDGAEWSAFGSGFGSGGGGPVWSAALAGDAIIVGGYLQEFGEKPSWGIARWMPRVNVSHLWLAASPGEATLGNDPHGFYEPALMTDTGTTVSYSGGLPVDVTMEQALEIHVSGVRVNGAFSTIPSGVTFGGSGATLRVEFSEDDVAAYVPTYADDYTDFRVVRLTYPPDYPTSKEASEVILMSHNNPAPIRVQNGKQIYAITVPLSQISSTYGAVPKSLAGPSSVGSWFLFD